MSPDEHDELTAAAIARLANVGRAAVANWRRRYSDFPKPVGGSQHSPTFSRVEVEAWLKKTGKGDQLATAGRTDTGTQRLDDLSAILDGHRHGRIRRVPERMFERSIADLTSGQLLARVMVSLLPRSTAAARPAGTNDAGAPAVLDPACFNATLLMAVADRFGDSVKLAGQEIQESAAAVAALNLRSNALGMPYEIYTGDSLLDNQLDMYLGAAAAVVCEPPFDMPQWPSIELATDPRWEFGIPAPRDSELAWVQHCYAHLRPRGVAVIAVTPRTCVQQSGQHIRAALVRSGALRDVIALPKGMGSVPDIYLWVLQRPYGAPDYQAVRMVDLSSLGDAADVPQEFAAWQRLFDDADSTISQAVPRLELLDGDVNLLPSRYIATDIEASADDFTRVTSRLQALYARVGQGMPRFAAPMSPTRHSYVTLGELERAGVLTIRSREATPRAGDLLVRTLGRPPVIATGTADDDTGVAQVVEIDAARLDAHFLATFLRTDANALPVANTLGALSREDLRRCRVPRLTLAEQRRYGDAFRHLQLLEGVFAALAKASANVIDQTVHGLTTGVLAPDFTVMKNTDDANAADEETRKL
ncbi:N-6 DNA methylase [Nonomuraea basaltis]|uniref:N-6 DNA methylase n=1 Tax=Nonomuraea basaltis TaxID=2495887 RepID=UPI00110C65F9|nr:N-6 DNA methylase [Nonomuraea basaltis]TMR93025.1 SAM-dependent DNA methyltransferase [Nonomuraea basaltis]